MTEFARRPTKLRWNRRGVGAAGGFRPTQISGGAFLWLRADLGITVAEAAVTAGNDVSNAAWIKTNSTTPDTQTIQDTNDGAPTKHDIHQDPFQIGSVGTLTCEARAGTLSWLELQIGNGSGGRAFYNISTGALGSTVGSPTVSITDIGGGWFRCSITGLVAVVASAFIGPANADGAHTYTGNGTGTILVRNISVEQRTVTAVADQSGNGRHFSQGVAANQPTYSAAGFQNGQSCLVHSATANAQYLSQGPDATWAGLTEAELFMVFRRDNDPPTGGNGGGVYLFGQGGASATHIPFSDGVIYDSTFTTVRKTTTNPTTDLSTAARLWNVRSASGAFSDHIDGVQHFSTGTNTFSGPAGNTPLIGANIAGPTAAQGYQGKLAELLVYPRVLNAAERSLLHGYFANRYAMVIA